MCTSDEVIMDYDPGWVNYVLFLPYDAITTLPGTYNVRFCVNVWHDEGAQFIMMRPLFGSFELLVPKTAGEKKGEEESGKGAEKGSRNSTSQEEN